MGFVRVKNIKGNPYAYLVENKWGTKGSRQRVTAYLGHVITLHGVQSAPAPNMMGAYISCVDEVIAWQLIRLGFRNNGKTLTKSSMSYDPATLSFTRKGFPARLVIKHHQGYLCTETLTRLKAFTPHGADEAAGIALARAVVDAGLDPPKEIFVALFERATQGLKKTSAQPINIPPTNRSSS